MDTTTPEEFRQAIERERTRQLKHGYDMKHDEEHGVDHLLIWAQEYARQGKMVETAALIEAAREVLAGDPPVEYEYMIVNNRGIGLYKARDLDTAHADIGREWIQSGSETRPIRRIKRRTKAGKWEYVNE